MSDFSITDSRKGSDEEGCGHFKHVGRHAGDELVTWVKSDSQLLSLLSREVVAFEMQDVGSCFSKTYEIIFSWK